MSVQIKSYGALGLGAFFTLITARTIFDDVWHGSEVTVTHLQAAAALVAAIASGHCVWPVFKQARLFAALGLSLIFLASTAYIVTSAGARNAELSNHKAALIVKSNEERAALKGKIAEAEADVDEAKRLFDEAKTAAAKECGTGKKTKCEGRTETRTFAARDLEKAESFAMVLRGKLSLMGPEERPFSGYAHAAKVFEAAGFGDAPVIEARLTLLMPFALVLISEVGTLVFLGMALGFKAASVSIPANDTGPGLPRLPSISTVSTVSVIDFQKASKAHKVLTALESQKGPVSNAMLARLLGETEGEASKSWREVAEHLEIGRQGKELRIALKKTG